jgi:hypothetical protein
VAHLNRYHRVERNHRPLPAHDGSLVNLAGAARSIRKLMVQMVVDFEPNRLNPGQIDGLPGAYHDLAGALSALGFTPANLHPIEEGSTLARHLLGKTPAAIGQAQRERVAA